MKKLNFKKLRQDMETVSNQIKFLRSSGRESLYADEYHKIAQEVRKPGNSGNVEMQMKFRSALDTYWSLSLPALRKRMTILCSIRAQHHGRLHRQRVRNPYANLEGQPRCKTITVEDQVKLIQSFLKDYEQEAPAATQ